MGTVKKNTEGHGYKYADLAQVNNYIESIGETYYQYIEPHENGKEYIYTVRCKDGKPIMDPLRGCSITKAILPGKKSNPAQEQGSALTYARRYSLYMAYGLATEDDDAAIFDGAVPQSDDVQLNKNELIGRIISVGQQLGLTPVQIAQSYKINDGTDVRRLNEVLAEIEGGVING